MTDAEKTVFISYRRSASRYLARAIFEHLRGHGYDVFLDVESIDSGEFERIILGQITARAHFLVILSAGTVDRLNEPNDWLRREIEYAIDQDRNIVPITEDSFDFVTARKHLTGKLEKLEKFNGIKLYYEYFEEAMDRLRKRYLKPPVYPEIKPVSPPDAAIVEQKIEETIAQPEPTQEQLTAEGCFNSAYEKYEQGDIDGAIEDYSEAIRLNPQFAIAYINRGNVQFFKGDYVAAILDYESAIRLNPQSPESYNNRGNAYVRIGDSGRAITDYSESIRLNSASAEVYANRGIARGRMGKHIEAIADFDQAIHLSPQYAEFYYNRGVAHHKMNDYARAITDFGEAIRLKPMYVEAYNNRGIVYYKMSNYERAIADYNEVIISTPQSAEIRNNRGEAYFASKDYEAALSDFQKAEALRPNYNMTRAGLAITYHALGNIDEALKLWRGVLEKDERYKDAAWVKSELNWAEPLVEEARKLIARL